ncbi:MAG TPA: hypothetical protein VGO57_05800, partial [Verrucomicrobiae bacterium]
MPRDMPGFWRKCRTTFRWCRISLWCIILLGLCCLIRLNRVGLPEFLKTRLVTALRQEGVQLEFARLRLSFVRGVVADDVHVGDAQDSTNATLSVREVQLQLNYAALFHRRLQVDGLALRDGIFTLAASPTNALTLTNLQAGLRFGEKDTWTLDHFHADFENVRISLSGELAHAPEVLNWDIFRSPKAAAPGTTNKFASRSMLAQGLQQVSGSLAPIRMIGSPTVELAVAGDARDFHSLAVRLSMEVPAVRTPWFSARNLQVAARVTAPAGAPTNSDAALGFWKNLQPFQLQWHARATTLHVEKMEVDTIAAGGEWQSPQFAVREFSARLGNGQLDTSAELDIVTRSLTFTNDSSFDPHLLADWLTVKAREQLASVLWTRPPDLRIGGSLQLPPWTDTSVDWRTEIAPTVQLKGELAFSNAVVAGATLDSLQTQFTYANQFWNLNDFELAQGRTRLRFDGEADEKSENFKGHLRGAVAPAGARPFLTASNLVNYFDRFHFDEPLALDVALQGNWRDWNGLGVAGGLALTNFSVTGTGTNRLKLDWLRTQFSYTNQFWRLSGLELAQGRTQLKFDGVTSDATENFRGRLRGAFDPESLRPLLPTPEAVRNFEYYRCQEPLIFNVDATGNWKDFTALTASGSVALTNFSVREQAFDSVTGDFSYTNRELVFAHPHGARAGGTQSMKADAVMLDFVNGRIYFTNGFSTVEPMSIVRCIGPETAKLIEPYQFPGTPMATVNGCAPIRDVQGGHDLDDADMTFVILKPTPFRWENLHSSAVTATVHWYGQNLLVTNVIGEVYGGTGTGRAFFDFSSDHPGSYFQFALAVTNVDLHLLAADMGSPS